jgi:hypothetical protein
VKQIILIFSTLIISAQTLAFYKIKKHERFPDNCSNKDENKRSVFCKKAFYLVCKDKRNDAFKATLKINTKGYLKASYAISYEAEMWITDHFGKKQFSEQKPGYFSSYMDWVNSYSGYFGYEKADGTGPDDKWMEYTPMVYQSYIDIKESSEYYGYLSKRSSLQTGGFFHLTKKYADEDKIKEFELYLYMVPEKNYFKLLITDDRKQSGFRLNAADCHVAELSQ